MGYHRSVIETNIKYLRGQINEIEKDMQLVKSGYSFNILGRRKEELEDSLQKFENKIVSMNARRDSK